MRRIARWADLPEDSHPLLNAFVGRRLLVKGERDGQVVVEVALESLLDQWDELAGWLRDEASDLREVDALERAAIGWERSGRHDDWLLDGARLTGAETLSARPGFGGRLNPVGEFLLASRRRVNKKLEEAKSAAEAHARSLRRRSQVLAALLAVIVLVAAISRFAFSVRSRPESGRSMTAQQASPPSSSAVTRDARRVPAGGRPARDPTDAGRRGAGAWIGSGCPAEHAGSTTASAEESSRCRRRPLLCRGQPRRPADRFGRSVTHLVRRWDLRSVHPGRRSAGRAHGRCANRRVQRGWALDRRPAAPTTPRVSGMRRPVPRSACMKHDDQVLSVAFSRDGSLLATAGLRRHRSAVECSDR